MNILAFILYGIDKRKAVRRKWRIPERMLLAVAVSGGTVGASLGMCLFRHKIRKAKFYVGLPLIFAGQIILSLYIKNYLF